MLNRNTAADSNGASTYRVSQRPSLNKKSVSCEDTAPRYHPRSSGTYGNRSTNGFSGSYSSIINKIKVCLFNFDLSEVIDHSYSEKDLEFGIEMKDYPCNNDIYASQYVLDYIEANSEDPEAINDSEAIKIKKM
jgi:hypothetical protein